MNAAEFERLADHARVLLVKAGFALTDRRGPEAFGDRLVEFRRGTLTVTAILEKGQPFLKLSASGLHGSRDIGLWEACMDRKLPSLEPRDFQTDLDMLLLRLPEFEALFHLGTSELEDCLRSNGDWRFNTRHELGLIKAPTQD